MDDSVGDKLRDARNRRKLSLPEVEAETKIRSRYLQAIENEEWDQLPEATYTRAFIRTYGRFLGLDGDRLAEEQRRDSGGTRPGERLPRVDPRPRPVVRRRRRRGLSPRALAIGVTALVVAALLAVGLATGGGGSDGKPERGTSRHHRSVPQPHVGQAVPVR